MNRRTWIAQVVGAALAPASQWRAGMFAIDSTVGRSRQVSGWILGCWGVRQYFYADDDIMAETQLQTEGWNVTHIPTGRSLPSSWRTCEECQRVVERIAARGDFSYIDRADHPGIADLRRVWRELREDRS